MIEGASSSGWLKAVRRCSVAIVLKIANGLDVDGPESPWIGLAEKSASAIGKAGVPAVPSWICFRRVSEI